MRGELLKEWQDKAEGKGVSSFDTFLIEKIEVLSKDLSDEKEISAKLRTKIKGL